MGEMPDFDDAKVAAFIGELRHTYGADAAPAPTQALTELFASGLAVAPGPAAGTPRRGHARRLGTAAKAAIAGVLLVGASSGLAAADLLPQPVDDTVSNVVPFIASDTVDDDATPDQGPGDAPGTPGADDDLTTASTVDDHGGDVDDDHADDDNSGPGSDDDAPTTTPSTIDDDDSTDTTVDEDESSDDSSGSGSGSGGDGSSGGGDDGDNSGSGSSGSGSDDD